MIDESKIDALIKLIDDPSDEVFSMVFQEFEKQDVAVVSQLEKAWENSTDQFFQQRIEELIHRIQFNDVYSELTKWYADGAVDLLFGAFLICKFQYPGLDYSWIEKQINELRKDVWFELSETLNSIEKVRVLNHIFFETHKYVRNNINILAAENNFISEVLLTKKGNPVALSIIYSVVAQRLGIPLYGVNLPKNFILAYLDIDKVDENTIPDGNVLFYVNPINKGAVLGRKEIEFFLRQQKIIPQSSFFIPCKSNDEVIIRLLNNLAFSYETANDQDKLTEISKLLSIFNKSRYHL